MVVYSRVARLNPIKPILPVRAVLGSSGGHACGTGAVEGGGGCLECQNRYTSHPPPLPPVAGMDETKRSRSLQSLPRPGRHTPGRGEVGTATSEGEGASVRGHWTRSRLQASAGGGGAVRDAGRGLLCCPVSTHNSWGRGAEPWTAQRYGRRTWTAIFVRSLHVYLIGAGIPV